MLVAVVLGLTTLGCGGSSGSSASGSGGTTNTVDVTIKGDTLTPNGARVTVKLDRPIVFKIDADRAGELHVHATPEQEIPFEAGTSSHRITLTTPGIVEVEDHDLNKVVVQLQAS